MPSGLLGRIIASVMERETAETNRRAIELLEPQLGDSVLDVGCGNGASLNQIASMVGSGLAAGVDHSPVMCRRALKNNMELITDGRVQIAHGQSDNLPYESGFFDAVVSVHTLYFWNPAEPHLREIARVLRAGGKLVLAFRPTTDASTSDFPTSVYTFRSHNEVRDLLIACGFRDFRIEDSAGSALLSSAYKV